MKKNKYDTDIENAELDSTHDGEMGIGINFFPSLDGNYPYNHYDYITFNVSERPSYYLGTAGARAMDALKPGGYLLIDINEAAIDVDAMKHMVSLFLSFVSDSDGVYRFQKKQEEK